MVPRKRLEFLTASHSATQARERGQRKRLDKHAASSMDLDVDARVITIPDPPLTSLFLPYLIFM
jgi:hypothetical protein